MHTCNSSVLPDIVKSHDVHVTDMHLVQVGLSLRLELAGFELSPEGACEHLTGFFEVVSVMQTRSVAAILVMSKRGYGCRTYSEMLAATTLILNGLQSLLSNPSSQVNAYAVTK